MYASTITPHNAPDVETTIDAAWENRTSPTSFFGLARQTASALKDLFSSSYRYSVGVGDRTEPEEAASKLLKARAEEGALWLLFEGQTPTTEMRSFVKGNSRNRLSGVLLALSQGPYDGDIEGPDLRFVLFRPTGTDGFGHAAWSYEHVPAAMVDVFLHGMRSKFADLILAAEEPEEASEEEAPEDDA